MQSGRRGQIKRVDARLRPSTRVDGRRRTSTSVDGRRRASRDGRRRPSTDVDALGVNGPLVMSQVKIVKDGLINDQSRHQ